MRKTYKYNSITIGLLIGLLVFVYTQSTVLGILAAVAIGVVGFVLIGALEKTINKGVDAAVGAAADAIKKRTEQKKEGQ